MARNGISVCSAVETNVPLWCLSLGILEILFFVGLLTLEWQAPAAKGPAKGPGKGPAKGPAKGKGKSPAEAKGIEKEYRSTLNTMVTMTTMGQ